jgi:hypothetical protein
VFFTDNHLDTSLIFAGKIESLLERCPLENSTLMVGSEPGRQILDKGENE